MIPRDIIDRIYTTVRIEEVISDYVTLRRRGANLIGLCPFHDEKTGSFTVSPAKGIYKCFGCGKAGNAVNFLMEYEQCTYVEALRMLAKKYHIDFQEKELTEEEIQVNNERESMFVLNEWANRWFQNSLHNTEEGQNIGMSYFMQRGIREDIIRKFQLGYSPEKSVLYKEALQQDFKEEFLLKTGLCGKSEHGYYDRFRDRVIFPLHNISGKTVGFAGRILKKNDKVGKYVNSPESAIYSKQNELYGLYFAKQSIAKQQLCFLVEGQMDVISMVQAGIDNVVSSGGTSLTHRQVRLLHRFTNAVTVLYDGDAAGIHAAIRGIDMLLDEGINVKVVLLPEGDDPDSLAKKLNADQFIDFINSNQQDFIHFKIKLLLQDAGSDPIKKSEAARSILQSISLIPDRITREIYINESSKLLGFKEEALAQEIRTLRANRVEEQKKNANRQEQSNNAQSDKSESGTEDNKQTLLPSTEQKDDALSQIEFNELYQKILDKNIRNILQVLMRYGDKPLFVDENNRQISVGEYILAELENEEIVFDNSVYQRCVSEYAQHYTEEGFESEKFFKFNPDTDITRLAVDLISEPYQLSKIYSKQNITENVKSEVKLPSDIDRLADVVPQLLFELKFTIISGYLNQLQLQMAHAQENGNIDEAIELMKQQQNAQQIFNELCRILGKEILPRQ